MKIILYYIIYSIKIILYSGISFIYLNYYCYILFTPLLIISILLIFLSNSWFSIWIIIEINLISFICIIIFDKNIKNELIINYFLLQSFNSYLFIISFLLTNTNLNFIIFFFIYLSILSKIGLPPFHIWYLKLIINLNWINLFFLSSIQKFIPLIILNNILIKFNNKFLLIYLIIIRIFRALKGLNNNNLKIILTYSSIIQISWIILLIFNSEFIIINYYIIYSIILINLVYIFSKFKIELLKNFINIKFNNKNHYFSILTIILSLRSLPPTFGFLLKLISIKFIFLNLNFFLITFIIINSLIRIYFYIKIIFNSIIIYSFINKLNIKILNYKNNYNIKLPIYRLIILKILIIFELF